MTEDGDWLGLLHDRVHRDPGRSRAARTVRSLKMKHIAIVTENGETRRYPIDMDRDAIAELETWVSEHKAHAVDIEIGDGYSAAYWEVILWASSTEAPAVRAIDWGPTETTRHEGLVYTCTEGPEDEAGDPPGLKATILAAVDHARRLAK